MCEVIDVYNDGSINKLGRYIHVDINRSVTGTGHKFIHIGSPTVSNEPFVDSFGTSKDISKLVTLVLNKETI